MAVTGFVRPLPPRYTEAAQRAAMQQHGIDRIIQEGGRKAFQTREELIRLARPGDVIAVHHLHLLADPTRKRKRGGTRADLWKAIDEIEARGCILWELYTGLRSDTKEGRDRMTREAVDTLARGRHKTRATDKRGRPPKEFTEAEWAKAELAWNSRKLKRWADVQAKLPKGMTLKRAWQKFGPRNAET